VSERVRSEARLDRQFPLVERRHARSDCQSNAFFFDPMMLRLAESLGRVVTLSRLAPRSSGALTTRLAQRVRHGPCPRPAVDLSTSATYPT